MKQRAYGFTIVELLIVIVVIGVLAAISMAVYTNFQGKARDAQRISDIKSIERALEVYKVQNGHYPSHLGTTGGGGWELSTNGSFLSRITDTGTISSLPVDPRNEHTTTGSWRARDTDWFYFYHRYNAGASGADPTCGQFYLLGVTRFETIPPNQSHPVSPGFSTPDRDWVAQGAYVTGSYTNC